jgi:hypothetical protein
VFVRDLIASGLAGGWYDKYPLMHYAVLAVPVSAFTLAGNVWILAADGIASQAAQLAVMRLVSVVMGVGALGAVYVCGAELGGPRQGVLAALALALTPLFAYYGKLANLDVPALCWLGWTLVYFVRILRAQRRRDYVLLGVMAAAAVATKDQAYANVALLVPAVVWVTARTKPHAAWWSRLGGALIDRRVLAAGLSTALASVVFHNLLFNAGGFVSHIRLLSTLGDLAVVPRTFGGYLDLTVLTARLFRFAFGWPLLLLVVIGLVRAAVRPERRWWLWLLLVPLSFHVTFTWVTLYVNDRYLMGGMFVLALFAGSAAADLMAARRWATGAITVVAGILVYSALNAASIDAMMVLDSREVTRDWVRTHAGGGARVGMLGSYLPYLGPPLEEVELRASVAGIGDSSPDYIVLNDRFVQRYQAERSADGRDLLAALDDGSLGYDEVFRYRTVMPAWAVLAASPEFQRREESVLTNLDKVNPEMVVYKRRER